MPVRIPKPTPAPPLPAVERPAPPPRAAELTREDVSRMLAQRDAMWAQQLAALTATFNAALQRAAAEAPKPTPRKGATITFKYDTRGAIVGADATPKA
jgi:hypothetical protein